VRARVGLAGNSVVVTFDGPAGTQARVFRDAAKKAFHRDLRDRGPTYDSYAVTIWIEGYKRGLRLDADNVAKAALDALTGLVWRDDRQVTRLTVEKLADGPARIVLAAQTVDMAETSDALSRLLSNAGLTGPGGLVR